MLKSVSQFFTCLFPALMRIYLAWRIFNKKLLFGDFSALMNASFNLTSNLRNLIGIIPEIKQHGLYIENLKIVLDINQR
jgi:ABC-type bacteriocin/lantibiotic exporter with double-glycine peptidase domain